MTVSVAAGCGGDDDNGGGKAAPTPYYSAPSIMVGQSEVTVFGGAKSVEQKDSTLLIGGEKVAWWTSPSSKVKTVSLTFNGIPFSF